MKYSKFSSIKIETPCFQRNGLSRYEELCDKYTNSIATY
jgi:hypothetical protein